MIKEARLFLFLEMNLSIRDSGNIQKDWLALKTDKYDLNFKQENCLEINTQRREFKTIKVLKIAY